MKPIFLEIGGSSILGNKWGCPVCPKRYRKKSQATIHILNTHPKKSILKNFTDWFKRKDSIEKLINLRQGKETERRHGKNEKEIFV